MKNYCDLTGSFVSQLLDISYNQNKRAKIIFRERQTDRERETETETAHETVEIITKSEIPESRPNFEFSPSLLLLLFFSFFFFSSLSLSLSLSLSPKCVHREMFTTQNQNSTTVPCHQQNQEQSKHEFHPETDVDASSLTVEYIDFEDPQSPR